MEQIKVSQINLQHSRDATAEMLSSLVKKRADVILIQEPYVYRQQIRGLAVQGFKLLVGARTGEVPRSCILVSKRLSSVPLPQLGTKDATVMLLEHKVSDIPHKIILSSLYLPYDGACQPSQEMVDIVTFGESRGISIVIGCDANSHHTMWGSTDVNTRGEALLEYLATTDLEISNRGREPTFVNRNRKEVIDITLASKSIACDIREWRVTGDVLLSDHRMIRFGIKARGTAGTPKRNPRATDWEIFTKNLQAKFRDSPSQITRENIDKKVEELSKGVIEAYEKACPLRKPPETKIKWWSKELHHLRRTARRTFRQAAASGEGSQWDRFRDARREFKKEVRRSKRASWREYCGEISSLPEAARLAKVLSATKSTEIGSIRKEDGTWTETEEETIKHLLKIHFPGTDQVGSGRRAESVTNWQLAENLVNDEIIRRVSKEFRPYKAAGPDGIFPALLQAGLEIILANVREIFRASLATGYVPKAWREANVVFIPKQGKEDYTLAKSFRPISLTSFMLKMLEKIVDRYLIENTLHEFPFHRGQHAYQKQRSTETALHAITREIERALHHGNWALAIFFDVEGAFDKARTRVICTELQSRGTPPVLVNWIASAIESRVVSSGAGEVQVGITVSGGCPQGSCLSPHLWCLIMDGLLKRLTDNRLYAQAYADDGLVLVTGQFLGVVCDRMQSACRIIEEWSEEVGLSINPEKTEMVLFTKKRDKKGFRPPRLFGKPLALSREVKYLGVVLDEKLTWRPQIDRIVTKTVASLWQLRKTIGKVWGLKPEVMHWLYTAIIRPRISYGSVVWWKSITNVTVANRLTKLQRLASLLITSAMRTTPSAALNVILGLPPLPIWIKGEAMAAYIRMRNSGTWKGGEYKGHTEITRVTEMEIPISNLMVTSETGKNRKERKYNLLIPEREKWERGEVTLESGGLVCFTDGSKNKNGCTGAGLSLNGRKLGRSFPLGSTTTVFQAEVYAILQAARMEEITEATEQTIYICTDSQAAAKALGSYRTSSPLVMECAEALNRLADEKSVHVVWVPAHSGVPGNEQADYYAKLGTRETFCGPEPVLGLTKNLLKEAIKEWTRKSLEEYWETTPGCRQARLFLPSPGGNRWAYMSKMNRKELRLLVGVLTGHSSLNRHLQLMGVTGDPTCPKCGADDEDSYHYIGVCEVYSSLRLNIFGSEELQEEEMELLSFKDLRAFIKKSGRFE